jgi:uncharacterized protein YjbI with pentapeptide repeats
MKRVQISNGDFAYSTFENMDAIFVEFSNLTLSNCDISNANFKWSLFHKVDMKDASLSEVDLTSTFFWQSIMDRVYFDGGNFNFSFFIENSLVESDFGYNDLQLAVFNRNDMERADLSGVILPSRSTHTSIGDIYFNTARHLSDMPIENAVDSMVNSFIDEISNRNEYFEKFWKEIMKSQDSRELLNSLDIPLHTVNSYKELLNLVIKKLKQTPEPWFMKLPEKLKSAILSDPSDIIKWSTNIFVSGKDYFIDKLKENYPGNFKRLP